MEIISITCIDKSHNLQTVSYRDDCLQNQIMALQWLNLRATVHTPVNYVTIIQNELETLPKHDNTGGDNTLMQKPNTVHFCFKDCKFTQIINCLTLQVYQNKLLLLL